MWVFYVVCRVQRERFVSKPCRNARIASVSCVANTWVVEWLIYVEAAVLMMLHRRSKSSLLPTGGELITSSITEIRPKENDEMKKM